MRRGRSSARRRLVPELPFAMPSRAALAAGPPVLAVYWTFPLYWLSGSTMYADNLSPTGNSSANIASGGRWRQRPYPFVDNTNLTDDIRIQWMTLDIQNAWNIGIDGFRYGIINETVTMNWRWTEHASKMWAAAETFNATHKPGFHVCPDIDCTSVTSASGDPVVYADFIAPLLKSSAAYTWQNTGRPVVIFYTTTVSLLASSWYDAFIAELKAQGIANPAVILSYQGSNGTDLAQYSAHFTSGDFVAVHNWTTQNYTTAPSNIQTTIRNWCATNSPPVPFIGTVGPAWENDRPANSPQPKQTEGYGLTTLMNEWQACILNNDPMMHIVSWNDDEESHNIRPSTGYQWVPYDVCAYYIAQYKTGTAPTIVRDAVYYCHRMHKGTTAYDTSKQTAGAYNVSFGPTPDVVIAHTFLKAAADVTITTGGTAHTTTNVAAGVGTVTAAMVEGDTPTFKVTRGGVNVVPTFSSAFPTRSTITYQDLCYRMGSSTRAPISGVQSNLPQDR